MRALYPNQTDHQTLMMEKAEAGIDRIQHLIEKFDVTSLSELFDATA
jgi:hypothetical protein